MTTELGKVASLWRYPVKSMQGEELSEAEGLPGLLMLTASPAMITGPGISALILPLDKARRCMPQIAAWSPWRRAATIMAMAMWSRSIMEMDIQQSMPT